MILRRLVIAVAAVISTGCGTQRAPSETPVVLVSVPPLGGLTEELLGTTAAVRHLVPVGANPDTYEPTMDQLRMGARARHWVRVGHPGFPLERVWLAALVESYPAMGTTALWDASDNAAGDPHCWLDPRAVSRVIPGLAEDLARAFPEDAAGIRARGVALVARADSLHAELTERLAPFRGRTFAVFHPAWGAFAEAYGLRQVALEHEGKEPSVEEMATLVDSLRVLGVTTVFAQPQFGRQGVEVLAGELGATIKVLNPLLPDWEENLRQTADALVASWSDE